MKAYLSSTFSDLLVFRARASHELRALNVQVDAMEDYVAADERPVDRCLKDVESADLYVGQDEVAGTGLLAGGRRRKEAQTTTRPVPAYIRPIQAAISPTLT